MAFKVWYRVEKISCRLGWYRGGLKSKSGNLSKFDLAGYDELPLNDPRVLGPDLMKNLS